MTARELPPARVERLDARRRLLRKLDHEEFRERARRCARLVREGSTWQAGAEASGLRMAAARALRSHPDIVTSLLADENPRPRAPAPPAERTSITVAEIEAVTPDDQWRRPVDVDASAQAQPVEERAPLWFMDPGLRSPNGFVGRGVRDACDAYSKALNPPQAVRRRRSLRRA
jgi:hypothetical protein